MSTTIDNKVKTLKTTDATTFLSWDFNNLKAKDRDVTNLKNAIVKNGWSFPVFVWYGHNYVIIDGAGRRKAVEELLKEGYTIPSIPYVEIEAKDLQEAKQKVLEVSSQFGNMTKGSILEFAGDDFDQIDWASVAIGFTSDDFLTEDDKDDETPVAPEQPQTELGDIYILGNHRILCGDSTKATDFKKLMDGAKADMVFTDPPYNVDYKGSGDNTKQGILNDKMDDEAFRLFLGDVFLQMKANIKEGAGCYVFHSHKTASDFEMALKQNHFTIGTQLIWNKPSAGLGANDYRTKHEPFFYCYLNKDHVFYGDRTNTTVWKIPEDTAKALEWFKKELEKSEQGGATVWSMKRANVTEYVHPTQKPVELPLKALYNSSKKGDIVLDLFLGSGSTLIACEKSGRACYGMELDPKYIDVVVERWLKYTNQTTVIKNGEEYVWRQEN